MNGTLFKPWGARRGRRFGERDYAGKNFGVAIGQSTPLKERGGENLMTLAKDQGTSEGSGTISSRPCHSDSGTYIRYLFWVGGGRAVRRLEYGGGRPWKRGGVEGGCRLGDRKNRSKIRIGVEVFFLHCGVGVDD